MKVRLGPVVCDSRKIAVEVAALDSFRALLRDLRELRDGNRLIDAFEVYGNFYSNPEVYVDIELDLRTEP